jgi:4-aminobutyrate aminotransferase-like enzyme
MLVLDSGAVSRLAERTREAAALMRALREEGLWPPIVPAAVLVECLQGQSGRDAAANRFLKDL